MRPDLPEEPGAIIYGRGGASKHLSWAATLSWGSNILPQPHRISWEAREGPAHQPASRNGEKGLWRLGPESMQQGQVALSRAVSPDWLTLTPGSQVARGGQLPPRLGHSTRCERAGVPQAQASAIYLQGRPHPPNCSRPRFHDPHPHLQSWLLVTNSVGAVFQRRPFPIGAHLINVHTPPGSPQLRGQGQ